MNHCKHCGEIRELTEGACDECARDIRRCPVDHQKLREQAIIEVCELYGLSIPETLERLAESA